MLTVISMSSVGEAVMGVANRGVGQTLHGCDMGVPVLDALLSVLGGKPHLGV